jgi:NCAIR mutase (PurE)-related protein
MDSQTLRDLLEAVAQGQMQPDQALDKLKHFDLEAVGDFAQVDHHRALRTGFPEVIWGQDKTPDQIVQIMQALRQQNAVVMATRVSPEAYLQIRACIADAQYFAAARICALVQDVTATTLASRPGEETDKSTHAEPTKNPEIQSSKFKLPQSLVPQPSPTPKFPGTITILTAGTADLPVAEEAAITAELWGFQVTRLWDVGVAGIHRLLRHRSLLDQADVLIVVAGMEGALPSVVAGLADCPVIAVPTSVGYGASFGGLASLLTMLNSCATGIGVVNIDNGFGAAILAGQILRTAQGLRLP